MNKKLIAVIAILALTLAVSPVYAYHGGEKKCDLRGDRGEKGGVDKIVFMKAHFMMENAEELGLSEEQVKTIKALKFETMKSLIKQDAEIKVLELDIMEKLHENPIDVQAVNKLVDQKYDLKKAKAKNLVETLAKLKKTLSEDQYEKMKTIWKTHKKERIAKHEK